MVPPFRGPPVEFLAIELIYFLVVVAICAFIYVKTKEIYKLTKHDGLHHFRNIFLYFGFAYLFRIIHLAMALLREFEFVGWKMGMMHFTLIPMGYFSTMAILSIVLATFSKSKKLKRFDNPYLLNGFAIVTAMLVVFTISHHIFMILQACVLIITIILMLIPKVRGEKRHSAKIIIYILLAGFWLLSLLTMGRRLIPQKLRIPLYLISAGVFISIFFRVNKRLLNAKKKR